MELYEPRRKGTFKFRKYIPLTKLAKKLNSVFDGFSVTIENEDDMKTIYERGFFGKANLSRSFPKFHGNEIIRKRQFLRRRVWHDKHNANVKIKKTIVVPDSDTEDEDYFANFKPEYQIDKSGIKEKIYLSLVEAYYLANDIECLNVYDENVLLDKETMWRKFLNSDANFIPNYVTYRHFRKKGWIAKPGIKFGGDYILYKAGPPYYHASYVVIIDVLNEDLSRKEEMQRRSMKLVNIIGLHRLCASTGKDLLISQLLWPNDLTSPIEDELSKVTVTEILVRRWTETQGESGARHER